MTSTNQLYELQPDWRIFLLPYILGLLLVPLFGLGLWMIYHYRKKWKSIRYSITNDSIIHIVAEKETRIALNEITACEVISTGLSAQFGLGDIHVHHGNGTVVLSGIPEPVPIAVLVEHAARSERERMKIRQEVAQSRPPHPSGTLESKNQLVGLWQQGLISEEDYQRELKKFES